jgi:signal peptidase
MEEDKVIKRKKAFRLAYKIVSYTFIIILMIIAAFFIFYILCGKIAEKKGENPPFNLYTIISPSMTPNIKVYDVVFVRKTDTENLKENDVITFYSTNSYFGNTPITHRIVEVLEVPDRGKMYRVKGDANETADEEKVYPSNIIGKVMFKIPQLGKLQFFLASKTGWLVAILIPAIIILIYDIYKLINLISVKNKFDKYSPDNI